MRFPLAPIMAALLFLSLAPLSLAQTKAPPKPQSPEDLIAQALNLPPGSRVRVTTESASGVGAGFSAHGDKIVQGENGSAPAVKLDGIGSGQGGSSESKTEASVASNTPFWKSWYFWIGIGCLAFAGLFLYRRNFKGALIAAAGSAGLIAAAFFPHVAEILVSGVVLLKLFGYTHASESLSGTRTGEGLRSALEFISTLPASAQAAFEEFLTRRAESADAKTINAVRNMDELHPKPFLIT